MPELPQDAASLRTVRLAIVIVNYQTPELVVDCLESLDGQLQPGRDVALVVDNASGDDSADLIDQAIQQADCTAWARLVRSTENAGFSGGNNAGMEAVDAEFYWLTNSDTLFRQDAVDQMLKGLQQHSQAGLMSPQLEGPDGEPQISCFRYHTPLSELMDAAKTGPISAVLRRFTVAPPVGSGLDRPPWTSFASVVIRRETLDRVGMMDAGYFMYYEDVDYCRRAWSAGCSIVHWPACRVVHLRGGSSDVKQATLQRRRRASYYYRSRARYFIKHYGRSGLVLANVLWTLGHLIARARALFGRKPPQWCQREAADIWQGLWQRLE